MKEAELTLAISVGMSAAASVAGQAGHRDAERCIRAYVQDWEAKVRAQPPHRPREMVRADILPPDAERYSVAADFGIRDHIKGE